MGVLHLTEVEAGIGPGDSRQVQGGRVGIFQENIVLVPAVAELLGCLFGAGTDQRYCLVFQDGPCRAHLDLNHCKNSMGHTLRVLDISQLQSLQVILTPTPTPYRRCPLETLIPRALMTCPL